MTFLESLLILLLAAIVFLQIARRAKLPYPAMLALAGAAVAFIPGAPRFRIDPETTLALFISPVLMDAAYDFPLPTARLLWKPLLVLVAGAVLATTAVVASIGWWPAGLPLAAAFVLGAIVAPPDAAAAVAVLGAVSLPRRTVELLKGESLFNDAIALLLFGGALAVQSHGALDAPALFRLLIAVPGGLFLGVFLGLVIVRINSLVANSLGGNLLQFLNALVVWILADRLQFSAVLAVVGFAMTVANSPRGVMAPRMRLHSFAVWSSVVFVLNVLAFLLMGLQAREILIRLPRAQLVQAAEIAACVVLAVALTRLLFIWIWNGLMRRFPILQGAYTSPTLGQVTVVGWSGMRGLVTLATAFALPADFPKRDLVVLIAFAVVLGTLVIQGLTLGPLIRALGLDRLEDGAGELVANRRRLAAAAREAVAEAAADRDMTMSQFYRLKAETAPSTAASERLEQFRALGLGAVAAQRSALDRMRARQEIDIEAFYALQEEIDWRELTLLPDEDRRLDEI